MRIMAIAITLLIILTVFITFGNRSIFTKKYWLERLPPGFFTIFIFFMEKFNDIAILSTMIIILIVYMTLYNIKDRPFKDKKVKRVVLLETLKNENNDSVDLNEKDTVKKSYKLKLK